MQNYTPSIASASAISTNKVLRNTYLLLSMTLLFSAVTAALSMMFKVSHMVSLVCSFGAMGLIWFVLPRSIGFWAGSDSNCLSGALKRF